MKKPGVAPAFPLPQSLLGAWLEHARPVAAEVGRGHVSGCQSYLSMKVVLFFGNLLNPMMSEERLVRECFFWFTFVQDGRCGFLPSIEQQRKIRMSAFSAETEGKVQLTRIISSIWIRIIHLLSKYVAELLWNLFTSHRFDIHLNDLRCPWCLIKAPFSRQIFQTFRYKTFSKLRCGDERVSW